MSDVEMVRPAEAPLEGHPDALCNRVANAILDSARDISLPLYTSPDDAMAFPRVAVECLAKGDEMGGTMVVSGELTLPEEVSDDLDIEKITKDTIESIGYTRPEDGFSLESQNIVLFTKQSADIAQGVDGHDVGVRKKEIGAGDQGSMCGFAIAGDGPELMPMPIMVAQKLGSQLTHLRKSAALPFLRPDGKTQVCVGYRDGQPVSVEKLTISVSHDKHISMEDLRRDIVSQVVEPVVDDFGLTMPERDKILINPTGNFFRHGPYGDAGVTGRKIIADAYGIGFAHGGGNWNGKDWTKVDMAGAVAARFAAKNIVAHGLARRAYVELTYTIGMPDPDIIHIDTFHTESVSPGEIRKFLDRIIDFRVKTIIEQLRLWEQKYTPLAAGGWLGRTDGYSWENVVEPV